jgi:hypothetical protein
MVDQQEERRDQSTRTFVALLAVLVGGSAAFGYLGGWAGIIGIAAVLVGTVVAAVALL